MADPGPPPAEPEEIPAKPPADEPPAEPEESSEETIERKKSEAVEDLKKQWAKVEHDTDLGEGGEAPKFVAAEKHELYKRAAELEQYKAILEAKRRKNSSFFESWPGRILSFFAGGRNEVHSSFIDIKKPVNGHFLFFIVTIIFFSIIASLLTYSFISSSGLGILSFLPFFAIVYFIGRTFAKGGMLVITFIQLLLFVIVYLLANAAIPDELVISSPLNIEPLKDLSYHIPLGFISIIEIILAFYAVSFDPRDVKIWIKSTIIAAILFALFKTILFQGFLTSHNFNIGYLAVILGIFLAARAAGGQRKGAGFFAYFFAYLQKFLFNKTGIIILILLVGGIYGYTKYGDYLQEQTLNPTNLNPVQRVTNYFNNFVEQTKEAIGFGAPDIIEIKPKSGIIFDTIITPLPFYETDKDGIITSLNPIAQAIDIHIDTFDNPTSKAIADFSCKQKGSTTVFPTTTPDGKEAYFEGLGDYHGEPLLITLTCDLKKLFDKITFSNSGQQWEEARAKRIQKIEEEIKNIDTKLQAETDPSKKTVLQQQIAQKKDVIANTQAESNPYLSEEKQEEITFLGTYKEFTTTTCLNLYTVAEENYKKPPTTTSSCTTGCNLATLSIETSQPWVKPKEGSSRYTSIYSLSLKLHNEKTSNGHMLTLRKLELSLPEKNRQQLIQETNDPSFIAQPVIDSQNPRIKTINDKLQLISQGRDLDLTAAEKTFYYRFKLEQPTGPEGKLQATRICAEATYDYQFTKDSKVTFKKTGVPP
ncbi:MAG TPA: hypothetical protein VJB87_00305 [Candidatus Nanoarchaeia archaeon]|nr:hypothetical protein [Candidatus Nanoarchaeia archaeon]